MDTTPFPFTKEEYEKMETIEIEESDIVKDGLNNVRLALLRVFSPDAEFNEWCKALSKRIFLHLRTEEERLLAEARAAAAEREAAAAKREAASRVAALAAASEREAASRAAALAAAAERALAAEREAEARAAAAHAAAERATRRVIVTDV